jgi:citrate synthase
LISFGYKAKVVDSVTAEKSEEARQVINLSEIKAQDEKIALLGNEITELRKHFDYLEAIEKLINNEKKTKNDAESAQKTLKILSSASIKGFLKFSYPTLYCFYFFIIRVCLTCRHFIFNIK